MGGEVMNNAMFLLPEIDVSKYNLGKIKFLKVREIIHYGDDNLKQLLLPFLYQFFYEVNNPLVFESLLIDNDMSKKMIDFLKFYYRTEHVKLVFDKDENPKIMIISQELNKSILENPSDLYDFNNEIIIIDRNNFEKLSEIICISLFIFKPKEEESQIIQVSEENKAILEDYLKLQTKAKQEEAERNKKNEENLIHQIITIVASNCGWDYEKVLNMTYYQLWNSYLSYIQIDQYQMYMQYKVSPKFEIKDNQKYWMEVVGKYQYK